MSNTQNTDIEITTDAARIDAEAAHAFLTTSYWSPGIPLDVVQRAIANSLCVAARSGGAQVGFARLVTDRATFAYLADVHVLADYRGRGIAHRMLEALFGHVDVQGLRRLMLVTRDAHALYRGFGFTAASAPERIMERVTRNAYAGSIVGSINRVEESS
ncbi:MAG: GNAT family N-acetyltransferase [Gemmatimonadaceae bacterium]|nr:GNAT family N-acetyltransferase [Gemmatimonadaceae bacterium]